MRDKQKNFSLHAQIIALRKSRTRGTVLYRRLTSKGIRYCTQEYCRKYNDDPIFCGFMTQRRIHRHRTDMTLKKKSLTLKIYLTDRGDGQHSVRGKMQINANK